MPKVTHWMPVEALRSDKTTAAGVDQAQHARWSRSLESAMLARRPAQENPLARQSNMGAGSGIADRPHHPGAGNEALPDAPSRVPYAGIPAPGMPSAAGQMGDAQQLAMQIKSRDAQVAMGLPVFPRMQAAIGERLAAARTSLASGAVDQQGAERQWAPAEVTVVAGEHGVSVWIRDAALARLPRDVLRRLVSDAVAAQGLPLDRLVCNGVPVTA